MVEAAKYFKVTEPCIDQSSDSAKEKAIKNIISQMLQFEPANRITATQVVDRLSELKGDKAEAEKPIATNEEIKGDKTEVETPSAAKEEIKGNKGDNEKPSVAHEKLKGNKTEGQKPKSRMPKRWPGSKN